MATATKTTRPTMAETTLHLWISLQSDLLPLAPLRYLLSDEEESDRACSAEKSKVTMVSDWRYRSSSVSWAVLLFLFRVLWHWKLCQCFCSICCDIKSCPSIFVPCIFTAKAVLCFCSVCFDSGGCLCVSVPSVLTLKAVPVFLFRVFKHLKTSLCFCSSDCDTESCHSVSVSCVVTLKADTVFLLHV